MRLGFTGTRSGMSYKQKAAFVELLLLWRPTHFDHGDCIGADDQAATIVHDLLPDCFISVHPPIDESLRAYSSFVNHMFPPEKHFTRNRHIVNNTDVLIGTPLLGVPMSHGGTWFTLRFGVTSNKPTWVIWPSGSGNYLHPEIVN